jgi:redox-sensitive bicupin YhaK (pirin superfamily)
MKNKYLINERHADIGDFTVGRLLPVKKKRQVGPITFLDHMGPTEIGKGKYMDVDQHPHIGLSTLTYLFDGSIEHRDSLGTVQLVNAGDVGFMTAGKGITHTERTPKTLRGKKMYPAHGYQVWIALPKEKEEMDPEFDFAAKSALPSRNENGVKITVVAGEGFGMASPVHVHSPLFIVDIDAQSKSTIELGDNLKGEIAIAVASGKIQVNDEVIGQRMMLISETTEGMKLHLQAGTRLLLLGGEPLDGPRYLLWNFVSSSMERLKLAKEDWINKRFPQVPGDNTYVPIP